MALFPVMSALKEFLEGPDGVLCVFGPVGCGKLTLCTQASKANGFELKPFEPGKAEGVAAVTLDSFSDVPRKVVFFWRGETLPPPLQARRYETVLGWAKEVFLLSFRASA